MQMEKNYHKEYQVYEFNVGSVSASTSPTRLPSKSPSDFPSQSPSNSPTTSPTNTPTNSPTKSPTKPPTNSPSESSTKSPSLVDAQRAPPTDPPSEPAVSTTDPPTSKPSSNPSGMPTEAQTIEESRIMQEVMQAQEGESDFLPVDGSSQSEPNTEESGESGTEQGTSEIKGEPEAQPIPQGNVDPMDADQFLPVQEPEYVYVDLRPFSIFVDADRDITSDLGIPLYLLLEMGETLTTLVDIKITNLTINMGVVATHSHVRQRRRAQENHYHWNQLFFHGLAQIDDSIIYPAVTVQNVQSLALSNEEALQEFWDTQAREGTSYYENLELQNITLAPPPLPTEKSETQAPTPVPTTQSPQTQTQTQLSEEQEQEDSKRDSNIWIMVPLVIVFLLFCFCIICLAGRLQFLSSRAQEKYNEKYGLDYNIYDKDIGKEIFKEEYLMSEHQDDKDFSHSQLSDTGSNVRSIDFITNPINSLTSGSRISTEQVVKKPVPAQEEQSTEEEEDGQLGGFTAGVVRKVFPDEEDRNAYYSHNGPMALARSENRRSENLDVRGESIARGGGIDQDVVVDEGIILPRSQDEGASLIPDAVGDDDVVVESVPPDEGPSEHSNDDGDLMPTQIKTGGNTNMDSSEKSTRSTQSRGSRTSGMGSSSARERGSWYNRKKGSFNAGDDAGMGGSSRRKGSFNAGDDAGMGGSCRGSFGGKGSSNAGDDGGVIGNSSRGSQRDRTSRFNRNMGSFNQGEESNAMGNSGRGEHSTRSYRSIRSNSESSFGSFYSCQGDLV